MRNYIESYIARVAEFASQRLSEADTKRVLIEPFLAHLGWDMHGISEVKNEWRGASSDNPVDYALFINRKPVAIIEAKALGVSIRDRKCVVQTIQYAGNCGVPWAVLTNGADWALYNALAPVDAEQKLFRSAGTNAEELEQVAQLLTKDSLRESRIDEIWQLEFTGQQISTYLSDAFAQPDPKVVRWIKAQFPSLVRKDIVDCLRQVIITLPEVTSSNRVALPQAGGNPVVTRKPRTKQTGQRTSGKPTAISQLQDFFEEKWKSDPGWFERNVDHPDARTRKRKMFGRSAAEIYPEGVPGSVQPKPIAESGWYFDANLSRERIEQRLQVFEQLP